MKSIDQEDSQQQNNIGNRGSRTQTNSAPPLRSDLQKLKEALSYTLDDSSEIRKQAIWKRRHNIGKRSTRENIGDLIGLGKDQWGIFHEYNALSMAAQRTRASSLELLAQKTPADGMVCGVAWFSHSYHWNMNNYNNNGYFAVLSYDMTVLAGTQGFYNHKKKDRIFEVAIRENLPVVFFTEGGGGRPGDVDIQYVFAGPPLDLRTFYQFGRITQPKIAINTGMCFAGNAALLGACDLVISDSTSNIGMAGPAMIEGAGMGEMGKVKWSEIGPTSVQLRNGLIDVLVKDEKEAVFAWREILDLYLWPVVDIRGFYDHFQEYEEKVKKILRWAVPEDRRRAYDVRKVILGILDPDPPNLNIQHATTSTITSTKKNKKFNQKYKYTKSLELKPGFGKAVLCYLGRIQGHAVGIIANNVRHLAGALDAEACEKIVWFMKLCSQKLNLPVISLCDTPGFMVGAEAEKLNLVKKAGEMLNAGAQFSSSSSSSSSNLFLQNWQQSQFLFVQLRKCYGLGGMAMCCGCLSAASYACSWPTGEGGPMGLEGAVRLGFKKELQEEEEQNGVKAREKMFENMVSGYLEQGSALEMARMVSIDEVIDPGDTRQKLGDFLRLRLQQSGSGRGTGTGTGRGQA